MEKRKDYKKGLEVVKSGNERLDILISLFGVACFIVAMMFLPTAIVKFVCGLIFLLFMAYALLVTGIVAVCLAYVVSKMACKIFGKQKAIAILGCVLAIAFLVCALTFQDDIQTIKQFADGVRSLIAI